MNSVVRKRSPLVRQTASERIALEIVYPGHNPAPGIGPLVSSACRPTWKSLSRLEEDRRGRTVPVIQGGLCRDTGWQQPGGSQDPGSILQSSHRLYTDVRKLDRVHREGTSRLRPTNFLNSFSEHAPQALPCSIPMISITRRTLGIPRALNAHAADSVALWRKLAMSASSNEPSGPRSRLRDT